MRRCWATCCSWSRWANQNKEYNSKSDKQKTPPHHVMGCAGCRVWWKGEGCLVRSWQVFRVLRARIWMGSLCGECRGLKRVWAGFTWPMGGDGDGDAEVCCSACRPVAPFLIS